MKLEDGVIYQLALMICGDEQYNTIFPYRTSSNLTAFFLNIGLDYRHDGSTRKWWVQEVLTELNEMDNKEYTDFPSEGLIGAIEALLNPIEYYNQYTDYDKAFDMMNVLLKRQGFFIDVEQTSGNVQLMKRHGDFISTASNPKKCERIITFCPETFKVPDCEVDPKLVAVMMPFAQEFDEIYNKIKTACKSVDMNCQRTDDIWNNSVIVQDIFELIFRSSIVIADFSKRNPNVFYEVGIAHTLGKTVIPIVQNLDDVPFDLQHHRVLGYLKNDQGRDELQKGIEKRLKTIKMNYLETKE